MDKIPFEDRVWTDSIWTDAQRGVFKNCVSCGADPTTMGGGANPTREYDNALPLAVNGGYGQFTDPMDEAGFTAGFKVVLCHDCAHEACDKLPWLKELLDPEASHSHTEAYREANPEHYGWDYDMANGTYYPKLAAALFKAGTCVVCSHGQVRHSREENYSYWTCSFPGCSSSICHPKSQEN